MRRTKILATLGPSSGTPDRIVALMDAGADAVRVNFSHGTLAEQEALVRAAHAAADRTGRPLPIVQDLAGTKVRIGALDEGRVMLHVGDRIRVDAEKGPGDKNRLPVDDALVVSHAKKGDAIVLGDGDVVLRVETPGRTGVTAVVESGGLVRAGAGITAPGIALPGGLTAKDKRDLEAGLRLGVDYVALSFVMRAEEVDEARAFVQSLGGDVHLISKIERQEALADLDRIILASDGILVARGDLGIALPPEQVPIAQKRILHACAHAGRLSITATQMLESMIHHTRPTRAEASDVANAILDGTGAVMLSGETAVGAHPVETVTMMGRIAAETEKAVYAGVLEAPVHRGVSERSVADSIALACAVTAEDLDARAVIAFTKSGRTAHRVAKHRPRVPILAATPDPAVHRRLNLVWGVTPILVPEAGSLDEMVRTAETAAKERRLVAVGDVVVVTGGDVEVPGSTNLMRVGEVQ